MKKKIALAVMLCGLMSFSFTACGSTPSTPNTVEPSTEEQETFTVSYNTGYTPTYFDATSLSYTVTELGSGVHMVQNRVTLKNGNVSVIYAIEVDLSKAEIHAGTISNGRANWYPETAKPYSMMTAYEKDSGKTVLASINADFFGATCLNALVKDGCILKAGHTITSDSTYTDTYLYTDTKADVPASAPMLFGVNGKGEAKIAPIIAYEGDVTSAEVKKQLVTSTLSYHLVAGGKDYAVYENDTTSQDVETSVIFHTSTTAKRKFAAGSIVYRVDIAENYTDMAILEKTTLTEATSYKATSSEGYLVIDPTFKGDEAIKNLNVGDTMTVAVTSADGTWDGYETILGTRQALVMDGEMAYTYQNGEKICTVTLENTNLAQREDVPRTAVGLKEDGTVVLFAVEALRYGTSPSIKVVEEDSYGLSLPQLADFMIYYGIKTGANFDGGGSTQLITRAGVDAEPVVTIRSSDTGSSELISTRKVMNSFMITTK